MRNRGSNKQISPTSSGDQNGKCIKEEKSQKRAIKELKLERIRDNIKHLRHSCLLRIDSQLCALTDSILGELERYEVTATEDVVFSGETEREPRGHKDLEKRFLARASPLSELMEVRHIRSLYHMFVAALIVALVSGAVSDTLAAPLTNAIINAATNMWYRLLMCLTSMSSLRGDAIEDDVFILGHFVALQLAVDAVGQRTNLGVDVHLRHSCLLRIDSQLCALTDSILGELERYEVTETEDVVFSGETEREPRGHKDLEKRFLARASPLSELMEVRHIRSLYHMFVAALIVALVSGAVSDTLAGGLQAVRIGVRHFPAAFRHFDRSLYLWTFMFFASCLAHPFLKTWTTFRGSISSKILLYIFDRTCILLLLTYTALYNYIVVEFMGNMGPASSVFLLLEQCRFVMKIHAFVRSNAGKFPFVPEFNKYLYFLFAPTLVYRDVYPRNSHVNWKFIWGCFVEFSGAVLMLSCVVELHVLPEFSSFGLDRQTPGTLAALVSRTVLPASLFTLCGFYLFLHAWLNAWAELLRFADRRFYGAWWNANSYGEYYRTWNCVVHDYLHTYIYKDVRHSTNSATAGKIAVFAVSAIVHEYILALMLGFCYPVMFTQFFGFGAALGFVRGTAGKGRTANVFLWVSLACGVGLQFSLYSMEAFARINCPKTGADFVDYFVPRSWTCNGLDL